MNKPQRIISLILILVCIFSSTAFTAKETDTQFSDVPENHWAAKSIHDLRSLKITDGIGNNQFGLGRTIKKSEFVAFLVKLMQWELIKPEKGSFVDNMDTTKWYYESVETALKYGVIQDNTDRFRIDDPITREEMSIMIVRALGYDDLAQQLIPLGSPFEDVFDNRGYITIAKDLEIIAGVGNNLFKPYDTAKREEAAVMMMRMYEKLNRPINELHAFYAIHSVEQIDMIPLLDSVGFGWSRLEYDSERKEVVLNTQKRNNNEYAIPDGFAQPVTLAQVNGVSTQLMVFAKNDIVFDIDTGSNRRLVEYIITKPEIRRKVINSIISQINATTSDDVTVSFDGVVIDFESMKGEILKQFFNEFLAELKQELNKSNKLLYVQVHPVREPGQAYFDGYDYKTIGTIADKVILMAHDYYAKQLTDAEMQNGYTFTPLSPINEVYYALKAITDKNTGVQETSKIWIQFSFDSVQWKLKDGKVINKYPYNPNYEAIQQRLMHGDVNVNYSNVFQNPYATFFESSDGTNNVLWYEDSRSIEAKIKLSKMFGIQGISLWRLGNIPDYKENGINKRYLDVWQDIF
ncbi:MAG: S-layer homology domain-containing protein [Clostridia bacterium]|nr:S-layer homology domain-containing protein [Clostridia bacterium]